MPSRSAFQEAVSLHQLGRLPEARRAYEQLLAGDPANHAARYQLAFLLYQQGQSDAALAAADAALALHPASAEAHLLRAVLLLNGNALEEALIAVTRAAELKPRDHQALHTRGVILLRLKRFADALASVDEAIALQPRAGDSLFLRARALLDAGRCADAVQAYDRALALSPRHFDAWNNRGLALYELERFGDALESFDRALAVRDDLAGAWTNRGKALERLGRSEHALESYERALALEPANVETLYARALSLRTVHRLDRALASAEQGLALAPEFAPLQFLRGWVLCELNRIAEGLDVIGRQARRGGGPPSTPDSAPKLRHDAEQRDYLAAQGVAIGVGDLHVAGGARLPGAAVNPAIAVPAHEQWNKARPRLAVVDNFLTDEALEMLRRFCLGSTLWRKSYPAGYLAALPEQGFACPLLAQIAEELRDTLPGIIADHRLRMLWGFKYDSRLQGIGLHADQAAVNVNFWITPDAANRNPATGGMVIWDVAAPDAWDVRTYNGDIPAVRAFLEKAGAAAITVPYRANRAVIFDSDLFHETDAIDFEEGYLNRRINVTMLYGRRTASGR